MTLCDNLNISDEYINKILALSVKDMNRELEKLAVPKALISALSSGRQNLFVSDEFFLLWETKLMGKNKFKNEHTFLIPYGK